MKILLILLLSAGLCSGQSIVQLAGEANVGGGDPPAPGPSIRAVGTAVNSGSNSNTTPTNPTHATDDILLLCYVSTKGDEAFESIADPSGWTNLMKNSVNGADVGLWWIRATSASMSNPTVDAFGGAPSRDEACFVVSVQGCITSGSPVDVSGYRLAGSNSLLRTSSITPTVDAGLVFYWAGRDGAAATTSYPTASGWTDQKNQENTNPDYFFATMDDGTETSVNIPVTTIVTYAAADGFSSATIVLKE